MSYNTVDMGCPSVSVNNIALTCEQTSMNSFTMLVEGLTKISIHIIVYDNATRKKVNMGDRYRHNTTTIWVDMRLVQLDTSQQSENHHQTCQPQTVSY